MALDKPKKINASPYSLNIQLGDKTDNSQKSNDDDKVIFRTRPSFYSVGTNYAAAAGFSILLTGGIGYFGLPLLILFVGLALSFAFPILRHIQRNRVIYTLTPTKIEIDFGFFSKTVRNIPLRNAQDVTVNATLVERLIGIGDVLIDSASDMGKIELRQIPDPRKHAELILQQLHRQS